MALCLKVKGLSKSFDALSVINNWDLEVRKGERLGIIGPSGCGKTTFLRLLAHLDYPTQGSLQVEYRQAGYVFQEPRLIPWKSVKDNLTFVCPHGQYQEILNKFGLVGFERFFPAQLSGGMAQRVNLARALISEPDLLLLDEAFFALDLKIKYKIMTALINLWKDRKFTIVSVTHNLKDALLLSDRILILTERPSRIKAEYPVIRSSDSPIFDTDLSNLESMILHDILS